MKKYADQFELKWGFPHCFGAIDGKHITMVAPENCGSLYYNYKGTHSIVLMGVADANYKLIYVDVGCNGRISDGGVFTNCSLHDALESKQLPLPEPEALPQRCLPVPYIMVADDAFAMTSYILKPYGYRNQPAPNRIFNYRLSRARRIIENVFGIMSGKFRVIRKPINLAPNKVIDVTLAICALHNFLMCTSKNYLIPGSVDFEDSNTHEIVNGEWRNEPPPQGSLFPLERGQQRNYAISQKDVRDEFREYFMTTAGEVQWQYRLIA